MQTASFVPPQGTPQDLGERLVSYLRAEDLSFVNPLQPARQDHLERYLSRARPLHDQTMPLAWLSYIQHFGQCSGILFSSLKITTDISFLIEYYEDDLKYNPDWINLSKPVVGDFHEVGDPLVMDLQEPQPNDASIFGVSESWENLTMRAAFSGRLWRSTPPFRQTFVASGLDVEGAIGEGGDVLRVWRDYCDHFGTQTLWFSDSFYVAGRTKSGLIEMKLGGPRRGLWIIVHTNSTAEIENLRVRLAGALGAILYTSR